MKEIAENIYASTEYSGVNVGFVVVPAGAVAIDAPILPQDARSWRRQIVETAGGPILYTVLTDAHPDRLLGAGLLGAPIVSARAAYDRALTYTGGFWRGVVDGWTRGYPEAADDLANVSVVFPEIMFTESVILRKGGQDVRVRKIDGTAPGSAWVHFRERNVLFVGDTLVVETHPFMEAATDTKAWLRTLTRLRRGRFSATLIVPGRGPLCDQSATRPLSDYIVLMRRRVRSLVRTGGARGDKAAVVTELLSHFPVSDSERDLAQRQIKANVDQMYEEFKED